MAFQIPAVGTIFTELQMNPRLQNPAVNASPLEIAHYSLAKARDDCFKWDTLLRENWHSAAWNWVYYCYNTGHTLNSAQPNPPASWQVVVEPAEIGGVQFTPYQIGPPVAALLVEGVDFPKI